MARWKKQSVEHLPEIGQFGNCMQACIASLLNLPMSVVPHFHVDGCDAPTFWERVETFVTRQGFVLMYGHAYDCMVIHSGPTLRGTKHCVIGLGDKVVHDPHESNLGLKEITHTFYLVPVDPGK